MDDYFDWVVGQLIPGQTVLSVATTGTPRMYDMEVVSLGHPAIRYSFLNNKGYIRKPFLNAARDLVAAGEVLTRNWCLANGMGNKPCSYRVTLQILENYPQP